MSYKTEFQSNNTDLQTILDMVNALEGGSEVSSTFVPTNSGGTSYKSKFGDNNVDLQLILEMANALPLAPVVPEASSLNDCSWDNIAKVAASGNASDYWSVGDCKAVTLNGTVGEVSFSNYTTYVYIIGFNHNGSTSTIDFGTFKNGLTDGVDLALIDANYGSNYYEGQMSFNINHWGSASSPYNTNYGGWKGCDLRYDILGSTDVAPSGYGAIATTSRVGYDATSTCATNPVANTLMAALPSELRIVMKPMTVYTDNVGAGSGAAENVTTSIDYLPLLSEFEVFGATTCANAAEQNYQAQYAYFANGGSKIKYRHSNSESASIWSIRSPSATSTTSFCRINGSGSTGVMVTRTSSGLSPIFRV